MAAPFFICIPFFLLIALCVAGLVKVDGVFKALAYCAYVFHGVGLAYASLRISSSLCGFFSPHAVCFNEANF